MSQPGNLRPAVRLWRIEHSVDGFGPFWDTVPVTDAPRPHHVLHSRREDWVDHYNMPPPAWDIILRPGDVGDPSSRARPHLRFAFLSVDHIRRWWSGWSILQLAAKGYIVKQVAVPWEAHRRYREQALYDINRARVIQTLPPTALFWL